MKLTPCTHDQTLKLLRVAVSIIAIVGSVLVSSSALIAQSKADDTVAASTALRNDYARAIEHASVWRSQDVKMLKPLIFDPDGTSEVVTVSPYETFANPLSEEMWVTVSPELQNLCRTSTTDVVMNVRQILGMPPDSAIRYVVPMRVKRADIFRPTPDPSVSTQCPCGDSVGGVCSSETNDQCGNRFPANVVDIHRKWFTETLLRTHRIPDGYPWTHLGYTYNWKLGADPYGASEYVVRQHAHVTLGRPIPIERYCGQAASSVEEAQERIPQQLFVQNDRLVNGSSAEDRKTCRAYYPGAGDALTRAHNCNEIGSSGCGGPDQCSCATDQRLVSWKCDEGTFNVCSSKKDGAKRCP